MDVEGRASLKRRAGRAGILVHRGAVAVVVAEDTAEDRWEAALCGRFLLISI
jgi:hypothetical protein